MSAFVWGGDVAHDLYSNEKAAAYIHLAQLPELFETRFLKADGRPEAEKKRSAVEEVTNNAPPGAQTSILQRANLTAVTVYDGSRHSLTIAFDPTYGHGGFYTNADIRDNANLVLWPHNYGGSVHAGLYNRLIEDAGDGSMVNRLEGLVHEAAGRQQQKILQVNFTGFSKGGAQAVLAAGEMMAEGVFDATANIKLGEIYVFSPPAYGSPEFISRFNAKARELGASVWTVETHGDKMPSVLTPDSENYFSRYSYGHAGNYAYVIPGSDKAAGNVLFNPSPEAIQLMRADPGKADLHDSAKIAAILDQKAQAANEAANKAATPALQIPVSAPALDEPRK